MAQAVVERSLSALLEKNSIPPYSDGDDVLYNYIAGAMEELDSEEDLEDFDLDGFLEMLEAYIPGFQDIKREEVVAWMMALAAEIREADSQGVDSNECGEDGEGISSSHQESQELQADSAGSQEGSEACSEAGSDEGVDGRGDDRSDEGVDGRSDERSEEVEAEIRSLLECFPTSCRLEVEHCLGASQGSPEQAAQLILLRQETGQAILPSHDNNRKEKKKYHELGDNDLKNLVLEKYGFVDMDDDRRTHRPPPLKQEPKKLVRYRDSQVVSMKGERFSEIKKQETEKLKETYVNLKPARKYRFH